MCIHTLEMTKMTTGLLIVLVIILIIISHLVALRE
jgi:hypothetical protein